MAGSIRRLNLVLLGANGSGKSASGNTILGRQVFQSKKSFKCVTRDLAVESGIVGGQHVTVYDTPGLFDTDMNEEDIKPILKKILIKSLFESRPCVFLLVIKADRYTEEERKTVEKIEKQLGENRLKKTWILFTRGDELEEENMTINEFINETESMKKLVQRYDQRYHVFNNKTKEPSVQANGLLIKIIKTYIDTTVNAEMKPNPLRRKIPDAVKRDTRVSSPASIRIVLLGKSGAGKSAAGNTILGWKKFESLMRMNSVTRECSDAHAIVSGRSVSVVDTPGFFDTQMKPEELAMEIARSVYESSPGPHAFLIVFPVNMRFTEHEQQIPQMIEMMFGEEVLKYSIILFTHGDQIEGESVEELIKESCKLRHLVDQCGGRFHVFNNKDQNNREQVNDLLEKIDSVIEQNGGGHYSNQMFEDAQRFRREEEERRQRNEKERRRQEEKQRQELIDRVRRETENKTREEYEAQMRSELEELKRKHDEEWREIQERMNNNSGFMRFFSTYKHYFATVAVGSVALGATAAAAVAALAGVAVGVVAAPVVVVAAGAGVVAAAGFGAVAVKRMLTKD